eukprot:gene1105-1203_t
MSRKLAVVTGANKGIGFEIAKKLCEGGVHTILACRDLESGQTAANSLRSLGYEVEARQLDINSKESIQHFASALEHDYGKLDILVNNAGMAYKRSDPTPFKEQARPTIHTNYYGTLWTTEALLPLIRKSTDGRVVILASMTGPLKILRNADLRAEFTAPDLTVDKLSALMDRFVSAVEAGNHGDYGWPNTCYGLSKLGLIVLGQVLARQEPSLAVNSCCPGWCQTDMSSHQGYKTAEQGSHTPAMLALSVDHSVTGRYYTEGADVTDSWYAV